MSCNFTVLVGGEGYTIFAAGIFSDRLTNHSTVFFSIIIIVLIYCLFFFFIFLKSFVMCIICIYAVVHFTLFNTFPTALTGGTVANRINEK